MRVSAIIAALLSIAVAGWMVSGQLGIGEPPEEYAEPGLEPAPREDAKARPRVRAERMRARPHRISVVVRGRTEASRRVDVRAETDGRVVEVTAARGDTVRKGGVLARLAVDEREATLAEYRARLRQREIHYDATATLAEKGLASREALAAAKADIDATRAAVRQVELEIARTSLRAPYDGVLLAGHAELGDYLKKGDPFARLIDLDPILFVGSATERSVTWLRPGLPAIATSADGQRAEGTVTYVAPSADPTARTYRVEVEAANPDHRIREGLTSELSIEVNTTMAHFLSPALLSLADDGTVGVKIVDDGDRVRFRPVDIIEDRTDGMWLVGLPPVATVITVGQEFVVVGQEVEPVLTDNGGGTPGDDPGADEPAGPGTAYPGLAGGVPDAALAAPPPPRSGR